MADQGNPRTSASLAHDRQQRVDLRRSLNGHERSEASLPESRLSMAHQPKRGKYEANDSTSGHQRGEPAAAPSIAFRTIGRGGIP
jgi:hypothetical protein